LTNADIDAHIDADIPKGQKETNGLRHAPSPSLHKTTTINIWVGLVAIAMLSLFVVIMARFVRKRLNVQIHHQ